MSYQIEYSGPARRDVGALERYLRAEAGDTVADRFIRELVAKVNSLRERPTRQRLRSNIGKELRAVSVGDQMIFYQVVGGTVRIVRVIHGSRNITAKLFPPQSR